MHNPASVTNLQLNHCRLFIAPSELAVSKNMLDQLFFQQVLRVLDALAYEVAQKYAVKVEDRWLGYQQKVSQLKHFNPDMAEVLRFDGLNDAEVWFKQVLQGLRIDQTVDTVSSDLIAVQQDSKHDAIIQQLQQFVIEIRQLSQYE